MSVTGSKPCAMNATQQKPPKKEKRERMQNNNYKGYSLFVDVKDNRLRAFNRLQAMTNINELLGAHAAEDYVKQVPEVDRIDLAVMAKWIGEAGLPSVQRTLRGE